MNFLQSRLSLRFTAASQDHFGTGTSQSFRHGTAEFPRASNDNGGATLLGKERFNQGHAGNGKMG